MLEGTANQEDDSSERDFLVGQDLAKPFLWNM
jgi:hypothetical protein